MITGGQSAKVGIVIGMVVMGLAVRIAPVEAQMMPGPAQIRPVQVSVPPAAGTESLPAPGPFAPSQAPGASVPSVPSAVAPDQTTPPTGELPYSYNPSGRRDPFGAIVLEGPKTGQACNLRPLQCTSLTELSLIGIVWGGFGYTAMVQAPDGKGYTIRQGTKIGPNEGIVSAITENALIVQERYTDVYGKKQVREYVKLLHPKENNE
jgi:type IV pilus assembly protein PilP